MKFKNIFTILLLVSMFLISGCIEEEKPEATLKLSTYQMNIKDNFISKEFITATIIRKDNENKERTFTLRFPDKKQNVYPTDVDGNRIFDLTTDPLKLENSQDIKQFKIWGSKGEADKSDYSLKVELWLENTTKLKDQDKTIIIVVK